MKKIYWVICGLVIGAGIVGFLSKMNRFVSDNEDDLRDSIQRTSKHVHPNGETAKSSSNNDAEIQRLRAELRRKDAMLLTMAANKSTRGAGKTQTEHAEPAMRAVEILNERIMLTAPKDSGKLAEMERVLKETVNASDLGEAKVDSLYCGGSNLCRLTLTASDNEHIDKSMATLGEQIPKTFGATLVLQVKEGEGMMYLAETSEDLNVDSPEEAEP